MSSISIALSLRSQLLSGVSGSAIVIPLGAIQQRDGGYILDRAGNYIEVRA